MYTIINNIQINNNTFLKYQWNHHMINNKMHTTNHQDNKMFNDRILRK